MRVKIHRFWKGDGATSEALCHLSPQSRRGCYTPVTITETGSAEEAAFGVRMPRTGIKDLRKSLQAFFPEK